MRCREAKATANRAAYIKRKEETIRAETIKEQKREVSAVELEEELSRKRLEKKLEIEVSYLNKMNLFSSFIKNI